MEYVVTVSDVFSSYLYGPFYSLSDAEKWANEQRNNFAGRHVHVIKHELIGPDGEE